jgi:Protein of unknown function (DUF2690)
MRFVRVGTVFSAMLLASSPLVARPAGALAAVGWSESWTGQYPTSTPCIHDARPVESTQLTNRFNRRERLGGAYIKLIYSPSCQTTWALLVGGSAGVPGDTSGCYAKIMRYSDGKVFREHVSPGDTFAYTRMVNDHNVTSGAYGYCDNGREWDGSTSPPF